jgi:hypothetical protein
MAEPVPGSRASWPAQRYHSDDSVPVATTALATHEVKQCEATTGLSICNLAGLSLAPDIAGRDVLCEMTCKAGFKLMAIDRLR